MQKTGATALIGSCYVLCYNLNTEQERFPPKQTEMKQKQGKWGKWMKPKWCHNSDFLHHNMKTVNLRLTLQPFQKPKAEQKNRRKKIPSKAFLYTQPSH